MTARRGLFINIDGSSNGTAPSDARVALASFGADDGTSALAARNGVFWDGQGNVVSGNTDTGTMSYSVRACQFLFYLLGTTASGVVVGVNDATFKATTTAAPGSNSRYDVIWVRQHAVASGDGGSDTDNIMQIGVTQGTAAASPTVPSIPTGAMALANALMPAGTTSTNALTITQVHNWTTTHGSAIPVRTQTERDAMSQFNGMTVYRLDNQNWELSDGSVWRPVPFAEAWGQITLPNQAATNNTNTTVTFPTGRFTQPPNVVCQAGSSRITTSATAITTTGFTYGATNFTSTTSTGATAFWHAVQMLSGNAVG